MWDQANKLIGLVFCVMLNDQEVDSQATCLPDAAVDNNAETRAMEEPNLTTAITNFYDETPIEDDTKLLRRAWLNERLSPTLLPYAEEVVGNILELLENQKALLEEQLDTLSSCVSCMYQLELERIKFMLTCYLKCRLLKVDGDKSARTICTVCRFKNTGCIGRD